MFSMGIYFSSGGFLDFKTGELMKPPSLAELDGWTQSKAASRI
jgi:hypothetical protein